MAAMVRRKTVSNMSLTSVLGAWVLFVGMNSVQAAQLEGHSFDDKLVLDNKPLVLNGLGLRGVAWIKAFVVGLYLPARTTDGTKAMAMSGPKRLQLRIMLNAPSKELSKAVRGGVRKNELPEQQALLANRVDALGKSIDSIGDLSPGDVLDLDFIPSKGTQIRYNGKVVGGYVAGEDFYRSVMKIFVGDRPVDKEMKAGLLRG
jgi:Chalcone isomerase-like